jgi:drug/metabolite transporter (DMT)-like permease
MNNNKPFINPYAALLIGAFAIASSAIMVKLSHAPAGVIATYRLLFTVLLMTPIMLWSYRQELLTITRRDWMFSALSGFFLAIHFVLWFESLNYTSVASSVVLVTLQPLFTFVGGYYFFKEKLDFKAILGSMLAILGSVIICWGDFRLGGMAMFGNILALLGAMMVSGYWLFGQSVRQRLSLMTYTYVVYGTSTGFLFLYVLLVQQPLFPYPSSEWLLFLGLAIFPTLLGHSVFNWALKWFSATMISMAILFEPIGAAILAYFILGEIVVWTQWLGGAIILAGIYLFIRQYEKNEIEEG